jgi:hypothetical protein
MLPSNSSPYSLPHAYASLTPLTSSLPCFSSAATTCSLLILASSLSYMAVNNSTTYADAGVMIIPKKVSSPSFFVGVDLVISVCEILFVYEYKDIVIANL